MATKIRLQRGGRKSYAFYSIVIADVRAPRDGKFTEKIGTFNPNTNPATVDLNFERALYWVAEKKAAAAAAAAEAAAETEATEEAPAEA